MTRYVMIIVNNEGGAPAYVHESLESAKAAVRNYLMDPTLDPPQTPEEAFVMEHDLEEIVEGEQCVWSIRGSEAWKEWIYLAAMGEREEGFNMREAILNSMHRSVEYAYDVVECNEQKLVDELEARQLTIVPLAKCKPKPHSRPHDQKSD